MRNKEGQGGHRRQRKKSTRKWVRKRLKEIQESEVPPMLR